MKVLSVIIAHPLRKVAGATVAGRELSIATAELADVELAVMWDSDESLRIGRLNVHHMRARTPLPFEKWLPRSVRIPLFVSEIPALIGAGDYDLVHIHNLLPAFAAEGVATACQRRGIPYVISSHGFNEQSRYTKLNHFTGIKKLLASWAIERPFKRVVEGASAILALSDREGGLLESIGVQSDNVFVVPNGVREFYLEDPSYSELADARSKFDLGDLPILMFMGSIHGYKGLDVFLDSLRYTDMPFQVVVAGQFRNEAERSNLLKKAHLSEIVDHSIVFTGAVSDSELRSLYHLADIFVYPTRGDTAPLVVLEAMACGLPIVSTTVGGIPFMVREGEGVLVEPDDPEAIARAVNSLLEDPESRVAMGRNARRAVQRRFRWARSAEAALAAYEAVLKRHGQISRASEYAAFPAS